MTDDKTLLNELLGVHETSVYKSWFTCLEAVGTLTKPLVKNRVSEDPEAALLIIMMLTIGTYQAKCSHSCWLLLNMKMKSWVKKMLTILHNIVQYCTTKTIVNYSCLFFYTFISVFVCTVGYMLQWERNTIYILPFFCPVYTLKVTISFIDQNGCVETNSSPLISLKVSLTATNETRILKVKKQI